MADPGGLSPKNKRHKQSADDQKDGRLNCGALEGNSPEESDLGTKGAKSVPESDSLEKPKKQPRKLPTTPHEKGLAPGNTSMKTEDDGTKLRPTPAKRKSIKKAVEGTLKDSSVTDDDKKGQIGPPLKHKEDEKETVDGSMSVQHEMPPGQFNSKFMTTKYASSTDQPMSDNVRSKNDDQNTENSNEDKIEDKGENDENSEAFIKEVHTGNENDPLNKEMLKFHDKTEPFVQGSSNDVENRQESIQEGEKLTGMNIDTNEENEAGDISSNGKSLEVTDAEIECNNISSDDVHVKEAEGGERKNLPQVENEQQRSNLLQTSETLSAELQEGPKITCPGLQKKESEKDVSPLLKSLDKKQSSTDRSDLADQETKKSAINVQNTSMQDSNNSEDSGDSDNQEMFENDINAEDDDKDEDKQHKNLDKDVDMKNSDGKDAEIKHSQDFGGDQIYDDGVFRQKHEQPQSTLPDEAKKKLKNIQVEKDRNIKKMQAEKSITVVSVLQDATDSREGNKLHQPQGYMDELKRTKDDHTYYKEENAQTQTAIHDDMNSITENAENENTAEGCSVEEAFKKLNSKKDGNKNTPSELVVSNDDDETIALPHSLKCADEECHTGNDESDSKALDPNSERSFEEEQTENDQHESTAVELLKQELKPSSELKAYTETGMPNDSPEGSLNSFGVFSDKEIEEACKGHGGESYKGELASEGTAQKVFTEEASGSNTKLEQTKLTEGQDPGKPPLPPKTVSQKIDEEDKSHILDNPTPPARRHKKKEKQQQTTETDVMLKAKEIRHDSSSEKQALPISQADAAEDGKIIMHWKSCSSEELHTIMCDPRRYMIFKYLMLQKQDGTLPVTKSLCKHLENLKMENNIIIVGSSGDGEIGSHMSEELYKIIHSNPPGLVAEGMPFSGSDMSQAVRHIEDLNKEKKQCLYFELFPDTELLYYVCKTEHKMQVQHLLSDALKKAVASNSDGDAKEERHFSIVVGKIFDKKQLKEQIQMKYPNVKFEYKENPENNTCDCILQGKKYDVEIAVEFVEMVKNNFCYNETSFGGFKENTFVPSLVNGIDEFLQHETQNSDDLFYYINHCSSKIVVASLKQPETDRLLCKVEKCIRSETYALQVPYTEMKMFIEAVEKENIGRVRVTVEKDQQIKLHGTRECIKKIKERISQQEDKITKEKSCMLRSNANSPVSEIEADVQDKTKKPALKRKQVEQIELLVDMEKVSDFYKTVHACKMKCGLNVVNSSDVTEWNFAAGHAFLMINGKASFIHSDLCIEICIGTEITHTNQIFSGDVVTIRMPEWTGRDKDKHYLGECVTKALLEAKEKGFSSVCVICKNVARWPAKKFASGTLHPIRDFFQDSRNQPTFVKMYCDDRERFEEFVKINRNLHGVLDNGEIANSKIEVVIGSLGDQMVDVIVNTTGSDLKLDNGTVSSSLLKKAGSEMQTECKRRYQDGIKPWEIAETKGYNLQCKKVFHGALEKFCAQTQNLKKMKSFVEKCLEFAQGQEFKSIAFPAIGTGVLGYPVYSVADIMFEVATEFIQQEECTLEKVLFVIHEDDQTGKSVFEKKREQAMADKHGIADVESKVLMKIHIDGAENDVDQVKTKLKAFGQITRMTEEPDALKADEAVGGRDVEQKLSDVKDYQSQDSQNRNVELTEDTNTECYVFVKNVPKCGSSESLWRDMIKPGFPVGPPLLIYHPQEKDALLICNSKADAAKLCKLDKFDVFIFEPHKPCLQDLEMKLDREWLQLLASQQKYEEFVKTMKDIHVHVCTNGTIKAGTTYQLKVVKHIISDWKSVENACKTIDDVSDDIWNVVCLKKQARIGEFTADGGNIEFKNGKIHLSASNKDLLSDILSVLQTYVNSLSQREFLELPVNPEKKCSEEDIKKWCSEIEEELEQECCVYISKTNMVLAFCKTYENNLKVKHLLRVKKGEIKSTARGKRFVKESKTQEEPIETKQKILPMRDDVRERDFFQTKEGIKVYVYVADILNLDVDCIVNAANDRLQHGGGVAAVIQRGAGYALKNASQDYISKHGKLKAGEACTTTAGDLRYKCVIHAVGPCWSDYYPHNVERVEECRMDLMDAITNSFLEAERYNLKSIALPAISSAIFGVPEKLCIYHYVKATVLYSGSYASKSKALKEIHFIDRNKNIIAKIRKMFEDWFGKTASPPDFDINEFISKDSGRSANSKKHQKSLHEKNIFPEVVSGYLPTPMSYEVKWKTYAYLFCGVADLRIVATTGDIFETKASAIVVTINENGEYGSLGKQILKNVHLSKTSEYRHQLSKGLQTNKYLGGVIRTHGFDCGYNFIIHAVFPYHTRRNTLEQRQTDIQKTYWNIFYNAYLDKDISSVVLPLIGIGKSQEETKMCAECVLHAYIRFCKEKLTRDPRPFTISVVCNDVDSFEVLNTVFNKYVMERKIAEEVSSNTDKTTSLGATGCTSDENINTISGSKTSDVMESNKLEEHDCVICMDTATEPKVLICGHVFCTECIEQHFKIKKTCPTCGAICGIIRGNQPDGYMREAFSRYQHCAGYEQYGQIAITYSFPQGRQGENHPEPGKIYRSMTRTAYLPDNDKGRKVLEMLKVAFERKLIFTIGRSVTTGAEGVITWNDIHHKTDQRYGKQFGYPDPSYLDRVTEELAAKGVTEKDIK